MTRRIAMGALGLLLAVSALASNRAPDYFIKACGMTGTPSSVVVDVYDDANPGVLLATIPNVDVSPAGPTGCYLANLATTSATIGFPSAGSGDQKNYTLHWRDDAASSVLATETAFGLAAVGGVSGFCEEPTFVYPIAPNLARGITQQVINGGGVDYAIIRVSCSRDFATPDFTYYEIYSYDTTARVSKRTPSITAP